MEICTPQMSISTSQSTTSQSTTSLMYVDFLKKMPRCTGYRKVFPWDSIQIVIEDSDISNKNKQIAVITSLARCLYCLALQYQLDDTSLDFISTNYDEIKYLGLINNSMDLYNIIKQISKLLDVQSSSEIDSSDESFELPLPFESSFKSSPFERLVCRVINVNNTVINLMKHKPLFIFLSTTTITDMALAREEEMCYDFSLVLIDASLENKCDVQWALSRFPESCMPYPSLFSSSTKSGIFFVYNGDLDIIDNAMRDFYQDLLFESKNQKYQILLSGQPRRIDLIVSKYLSNGFWVLTNITIDKIRTYYLYMPFENTVYQYAVEIIQVGSFVDTPNNCYDILTNDTLLIKATPDDLSSFLKNGTSEYCLLREKDNNYWIKIIFLRNNENYLRRRPLFCSIKK